jgi:hypothetical protein
MISRVSRFSLFSLISLALFFFVFCFRSNAYFLPSQYIVEKWVKGHLPIQNVRIKSQVVGFEKGLLTETQFKETTFFDQDSGSMMSWVLDAQGQKLFMTEKKGDAVSVILKLMLGLNAKDLIYSLKRAGIPIKTEDDFDSALTQKKRSQVEIVSFGRLNDKVAWVIGSERQLWIEKNFFYPLRFISEFKTGGSHEIFDIQFDPVSEGKEYSYQNRTCIVKKGSLALLKAEQVEVKVNTSEFEKSMKVGFTFLGERLPSSLKNLILTYYEVFR